MSEGDPTIKRDPLVPEANSDLSHRDPLVPKPGGELEHEEIAQIMGIRRQAEEADKKFLETITVLGTLSR